MEKIEHKINQRVQIGKNLKNASTNHKINFIWSGLIRGEGIFSAAGADAQVKALFDQSTYIKTGN